MKIDANGIATIAWSDTQERHRARHRLDRDAAGRAQHRQHVADLGEAQYAYTPTIGYVITGTLTLKDQIYMRPRLSDTVTRTATLTERVARRVTGSAAPSST